ncbi:MAG: hypothetical protein MJZ00_06085 [Paludibacteraceae bacterium]|nr:hypothetical protein [Paludibacteraceae bacterium]
MNKRTITTLCSVSGIFLATALLVGNVYKKSLSRPPIRHAEIPDSTLDFLRGIIRMGGHMAGVKVEIDGPFDWENEKDLGNTEEDWAKEEDDFFIVYYKKDKDAVWQGHALNTLKAANGNITPLIKLMGKYYYPSDANGRKLPIYLTTSVEQYGEVASKLLGGPYDSGSSIGVTISQVGRAGCKASIVLHPICFVDPPRSHNGYVSVLMHEMNHYTFMSNIDIGKNVSFRNWEIEGIADYCSNNFIEDVHTITDESRISYIDKDCNLLEDFDSPGSEYWAGESYFRFMVEERGEKFLKEFLQKAYVTKVENTFAQMDLNPSKEHTNWVENLKKKSEKQKEEFLSQLQNMSN